MGGHSSYIFDFISPGSLRCTLRLQVDVVEALPVCVFTLYFISTSPHHSRLITSTDLLPSSSVYHFNLFVPHHLFLLPA